MSSKEEKLVLTINPDKIEEGAWNQINATLNIPSLEKLVILPDVHQGYELPIGGVALLNNYIWPGAVGADIGCLSGSTKIPLLDGNDYTLKELYDRDVRNFFVFSVDENQKYTIGVADKVKKTREDAKLMKVSFDNGSYEVVTPDHEFLLLDGSYKQAKDLDSNECLMPFRKVEDRDGYDRLFDPYSKDYLYGYSVHWLMAKSGFLGEIPIYEDDKTSIHHEDENKKNNLPENLKFMKFSDHMSYHASKMGIFKTDEFKIKKMETIRNRGFFFKTEESYRIKANVATQNIKNYMKNNPEHFSQVARNNAIRGGRMFSERNNEEYMKNRQKLGKIRKILLYCLENYGEINRENYEKSRLEFYNGKLWENANQIVENLGLTFDDLIDDDKWNDTIKEKCGGNHKVVSVEFLDHTEDVYDITVYDHHNFALSSGVIVHNCGMVHVNTGKTLDELKLTKKKQREKLYNDILNSVPTICRETELDYKKFPNSSGDKNLKNQVESKAGYQMGSTGQGNHFIELGINDKNQVGITIHSGSRNPGKTIADYWMKRVTQDGEFFSGMYMYKLNSEPGQQYLNDMRWAQDYALENRKLMVKEILKCMKLNPDKYDIINENHNLADIMEGNLIRHRKGATPADKGQLGIIPSNQRDGVYITEGLGNEKYLSSASHGAGRVMSRNKAKKSIKLESFQGQMKGIISRTDKNVLDEAPDAYKNINDVLAAQDGIIVNVIDHFKPLIVIKG